MRSPRTSSAQTESRLLRTVPWLIFFGALIIFTVRMRSEFLMIDTRFALFVHEMRETGMLFWPTLYGKPYPDYTGLSTLLSLCAAEITGKVDYFSLILPSAVAGAFLIVMTWKTGVRLFSVRIAAAAVLLGFGATACIRTESEIKPIEIKPVEITLNINIRIEKALDDFFGDLDNL